MTATQMTQTLQHRDFEAPDEIRTFENGRLELLHVGPMDIGRLVLRPMFRSVAKVAGSNRCRATGRHGELMRQTLARAVHWIGLRSGYALRLARQAGKPRILMYHAIGADDTPVESFIHQLQVLRQEFELVSLAELLDRRAQRKATGR